MRSVSLADAKAGLSDLVSRVAAGETVTITRHGKPVARLSAVEAPRQSVNRAELEAVTDSLPPRAETATDLVRAMRDGDRY